MSERIEQQADFLEIVDENKEGRPENITDLNEEPKLPDNEEVGNLFLFPEKTRITAQTRKGSKFVTAIDEFTATENDEKINGLKSFTPKSNFRVFDGINKSYWTVREGEKIGAYKKNAKLANTEVESEESA